MALEYPLYRLIFLFTTIMYGLLYAFATGIILVYETSLVPVMEQAGFSIPYFRIEMVGGPTWTNPSVVWFPMDALEIYLPFGQILAWPAISALVGFNVALLARNLKTAKWCVVPSSTWSSLPALLVSCPCCGLPIAGPLLATVFSTSPLLVFFSTYNWLVVLLNEVALMASIAYLGRNLMKARAAASQQLAI